MFIIDILFFYSGLSWHNYFKKTCICTVSSGFSPNLGFPLIWVFPWTGFSPDLGFPLFWVSPVLGFPCSGFSLILGFSLFWVFPYLGFSPILGFSLFWVFPYSGFFPYFGFSPIMGFPLFWVFPFFGFSPILGFPLFWVFPYSRFSLYSFFFSYFAFNYFWWLRALPSKWCCLHLSLIFFSLHILLLPCLSSAVGLTQTSSITSEICMCDDTVFWLWSESRPGGTVLKADSGWLS